MSAEKLDHLIEHEQITTSSLPLASRNKRVFAFILDCVLSNFALAAIVTVFKFASLSSFSSTVLGNLFILMFYWFVPTAATGQTLAKRILGIKVVDSKGNEELGIMQSLLRESLGRFLSTLLLGIGYIMSGFRKDSLTLHDIIAKTKVVQTQ